MNIRWTTLALGDLESLHEYIALDKPGAADKTANLIVSGIEALARSPQMGRKGRSPGTRELVIAPFVVIYRVVGDTVEVLAIMHGARRWPTAL